MSTTRPAPTRRRPTRPEVRAALLEAAARLFARYGIDGTSIDDVAHAAGDTKGAGYSNFGSKQGLVEALVDEHTAAYLDLGLAAVRDLDAPLPERARLLGDRLTAASEEQRDWHLLFLELWQLAVRSEQHQGPFLDRRRALREAITDAVRQHADQAGASLPIPADQLATVLMALSNGLAIERLLEPSDVPADLMGTVLAQLVQPTQSSDGT